MLNNKNKKPTIIYYLFLMDCMIPDMDGYESTKRIREEAKLGQKRIPIIALTANTLEGDREHCLTTGMDDYLTKPFLNGLSGTDSTATCQLEQAYHEALKILQQETEST